MYPYMHMWICLHMYKNIGVHTCVETQYNISIYIYMYIKCEQDSYSHTELFILSYNILHYASDYTVSYRETSDEIRY